MTWNIYYRGSLSSCNYSCHYCPFAKTRNSRAQLRQDQQQLEQFTDWAQRPQRLGVLITPWGEALGHGYYRRALVRLSHCENVYRVALQTNLSAPLSELAEASSKLALWTTYHPSQTTLKRFAHRCRQLEGLNIRHSVGVVGLREHFADIAQLRQLLPSLTYLWINAYKREPNYYTAGEVQYLKRIDPYFAYNLPRYPSLNSACRAGHTSFAVDGQGDMRRCHFVGEVLGNIYQPDFSQKLRPRLCPNQTCGCHIGYIHRPQLRLESLYGEGLLERIPLGLPGSTHS